MKDVCGTCMSLPYGKVVGTTAMKTAIRQGGLGQRPCRVPINFDHTRSPSLPTEAPALASLFHTSLSMLHVKVQAIAADKGKQITLFNLVSSVSVGLGGDRVQLEAAH